MKKRIFSILLCLCMMLLLLPMMAKAMEIYVDVNITGATALTLEVESGDSIDVIKEKIHAETGYPVTQQILMFDDKLLEDGKTLTDYKIVKESTLVLSLAVPEGLQYSGSDNKVTITGYTGSAAEIAIPDKIESKPVTAIGTEAFKGITSLTSVTIPEGVTSIGERTFENCTSLTSATIPGSVTSIAEYAFCNCASLTSVNIPAGVTSIEEATFFGCSSLKSIKIPSGVTSIGISAFAGCSSLKSITIPGSVTSIGNAVFSRCTSLESIDISDSVTSINYKAFDGCTSLKSIDIPDGVTSIGEEAFSDCTSLESVTIPNSVTSIRPRVFQNCISLKSVDIPDSVTLNYAGIFKGCTSLTSVTIPNSVTFIADDTFSNCTSLTSVTIPKSVTSIGQRVFQNCVSLKSVDIPDSVTLIYAGVFKGCTSLESIFLPDNNELTIGPSAISSATSQVKYSLDAEKGEVTITEITLGTDKTGVAISATVCGYPVTAVAADQQSRVGTHSCIGGTKTCSAKAVCSLCGKGYGELDSTNHNLEKIPATDATVTETGNKEYWHCKDCGKYFADENGTKEIKLEDTIISKLSPEIIEGKGQSIAAGEKKELTFKSNTAFSDFIRAQLDGKTLDDKNYTVKEGSTVVTLKADYVAALSAGEHTIGIVSTNGTATTTFTVNEKAAVNDDKTPPQTGDNSHMALWIALLAVSMFGLAGTAVYIKRKRVR